jgi:hypothetical protein
LKSAFKHTGVAALVLACMVVLLVVALAACGGSTTTTTTALPATTTTSAASTTSSSVSGPTGGTPVKIEVPLSGGASVPPVQTSATGMAIISLEAGPNGYNISFELDVTNIVDVTAAHIHLGAADANGGVIVPLFTGPKKSGSFTGVLAKGSITEADLTGAMKGKTFADLAAAVLSGQTYVNVHTVANPNGEIRGQIIIPGASTATTAAAGAGASTTTASGAGASTTTTAGGY